ncbi:MAG: hypothetical protein K2G83_02555 [Ruminococcus sp.]|nr:hypothetical protein [Ruminococcus sp.]
MTTNQHITKHVWQVTFLSVLLIIQIFVLTKLVGYDKMLRESVIDQSGSELDQLIEYDINNDGVVDYQDLEKLEELLANKNNLTEEELDRYDLNKKNGFDTYDRNVLKKYLNGEN